MPDNPRSNKSQADTRITKNDAIADIRKLKRTQRQLLPAEVQQQHSESLCQNIIRHRRYRYSQHIACYLANEGEIDPSPLIEHAWFTNKTVYLPVLSPINNSLYFAPYEENTRFRNNRFNIAEPICRPSDWIKASQLDLLLLPLVAFDTKGNRIGMGGGFYDRTLAYLRHRQFWKKPTLLGLAHEIQKVGQLEAQDWDIPLDGIITEKQSYHT